jgi:general secretion pathway protein D
VDKKNNTILLNLRPTVSRIVSYKDVPFFYQTISSSGNANASQGTQYHRIPIVDVRELDSVLKLNSGQIVVMGGLMQESSHNNRDGLPHNRSGSIFKAVDFLTGSNDKSTHITELVIFLKATILRNRGKAHHAADKRVYETFANDPRPLRFKK